MLPIIQVGPFSVRAPGLVLLASMWIALEVAQRVAVRRGIDGDRTYNLGLIALVTGILGARLSFVLFNLDLYTSINPVTRAAQSVFALAPGTEYPVIGVLIAIVAAGILIWRWHLDALRVLDTFSPSIVVLIAGISAANLLSGQAYGAETSLIWAIPLWGAHRHPTQLLLIGASLLTLFALWKLGIRKTERTNGFYAQITTLILCGAILLIEPLRADSRVIFGGIRTWEMIGLVGMLASLVGFMLRAPVRIAPAS